MDKTVRLPRKARVTDFRQLTETGTYLISFQVIDDDPFDFHPCQFVAIDCQNTKWGYRRSPYCICSPPNHDRTFQLLVRRIPTGPVSLFISELEVKDVISFRGPQGPSMVPEEPDTELILIATGVGLSAFNSLLHHLLPNGFQRSIRLFWGLRLKEDICLTEDLTKLSSKHANFEYQISLSQPSRDWQGLCGRVSETVPPLLSKLRNKHFYLCGNGAMICEWSAVLSQFGIPRSLLFEEYFFNFHHNPDEAVLADLQSRFIAKDVISPYQEARNITKNLELAD